MSAPATVLPVVTTSALRLRIGILLIFLWWIPFWLAEPAVAHLLGVTSASGKKQLTIVILGVQTVIGLVGFVVAGKQVALILKKVSYRKMPGAVWRAVVHGQISA